MTNLLISDIILNIEFLCNSGRNICRRIEKEKSMVYNPDYKGIRLDIFAKDEARTRYNVEMQAVKHEALGKRSRYYHSQMDVELLLSGAEYSDLPDYYVIFICDFDPFGEKKYRYTFETKCLESNTVKQKMEEPAFFSVPVDRMSVRYQTN